MIIKDNDIYYVERRPGLDGEDDIRRYDRRFGKGRWEFTEDICSSIGPDCGYGPSYDQCPYKDGRCVRPLQQVPKGPYRA